MVDTPLSGFQPDQPEQQSSERSLGEATGFGITSRDEVDRPSGDVVLWSQGQVETDGSEQGTAKGSQAEDH